MDAPNRIDGSGANRTPELDGVRGLAFLLVLLVHARPPADGAFNSAFNRYAFWGVTGVDLFFILSGFLITAILLRTKGQSGYYGRFYGRRALRILPLYYTVLIIVLGVLPLVGVSDRSESVYQNQAWLWTFTTNFPLCYETATGFSTKHFTLVHLWSLAIEEQFYLVWPVVVALLSRRWLVGFCVALLAGAAAARVAAPVVTGCAAAPYFFSLCRFDALAAGALLAVAQLPGGAPGSGRWRTPVRLALGVISVVALAWLVVIRPTASGGTNYFWSATHPVAPFAIIGGGCYLVLTAIHARPWSPVRTVLRLWPLRLLGQYSYAMYVFHVPVACLLAPKYSVLAARLGFGPRTWFIYLAAITAITLLLAVISWWVIEGPCLRLKDRLFAPHPPGAPAPAGRWSLTAVFRRLARHRE
jgi:peptidoglycan/LPS O-acetylase OafA/YrhL